jgi:hypothetical protein
MHNVNLQETVEKERDNSMSCWRFDSILSVGYNHRAV